MRTDAAETDGRGILACCVPQGVPWRGVVLSATPPSLLLPRSRRQGDVIGATRHSLGVSRESADRHVCRGHSVQAFSAISYDSRANVRLFMFWFQPFALAVYIQGNARRKQEELHCSSSSGRGWPSKVRRATDSEPGAFVPAADVGYMLATHTSDAPAVRNLMAGAGGVAGAVLGGRLI